MSRTSTSRRFGPSGQNSFAACLAEFGRDDEPPDIDWDDFDLDPATDDIWEPSDLEEDEEPLPEYGDFWPEQDDFENERTCEVND